ncbi:carboxypeptidase-like regulatory domain-containing protein [Gramella sp. MAR_2010_147]|uniref:carboxypeptidase-like regulatory domain-containing protein n=1 Tax=Gramella sp. MAR_2010_147 TaxID=1250205 RepID=UPI00087DCEA0|nr:carboxypeptidase-like regulatory domain-containing protein [Gramella sp. MAR_2010_147]SDS63742.1 hypothetical protein SAMN04488553_2726 [Gramella sp. MAR_2010_147]
MTDNKGGYIFHLLDNDEYNENGKVEVFGQVVDIETKKPLSNSELIIGCKKVITSTTGKYSIIIEKDQLFYVQVSSIGYKKVETDFIKFQNQNSINLDFFLDEDDKPLINCEGNI